MKFFNFPKIVSVKLHLFNKSQFGFILLFRWSTLKYNNKKTNITTKS